MQQEQARRPPALAAKLTEQLSAAGALGTADRTRSGPERRDRTTAVAILAAAHIGTYVCARDGNSLVISNPRRWSWPHAPDPSFGIQTVWPLLVIRGAHSDFASVTDQCWGNHRRHPEHFGCPDCQPQVNQLCLAVRASVIRKCRALLRDEDAPIRVEGLKTRPSRDPLRRSCSRRASSAGVTAGPARGASPPSPRRVADGSAKA
jgi:hypothetical protein